MSLPGPVNLLIYVLIIILIVVVIVWLIAQFLPLFTMQPLIQHLSTTASADSLLSPDSLM